MVDITAICSSVSYQFEAPHRRQSGDGSRRHTDQSREQLMAMDFCETQQAVL